MKYFLEPKKVFILGMIFFTTMLGCNYFNIIDDNIIDQLCDVLTVWIALIIFGMTIFIYKKIDNTNKKLFIWVVLAALVSFLGSLLCHLYYYETTVVGLWSFFMFYIVWLIFLSIYLIKNLYKILTLREFYVILPIYLLFNLIIIILFFLSRNEYISHLTASYISLDVSAFLELILFDLAVLSLTYSKVVDIQFFISGILVILSTSFLYNSGFVEQTVNPIVAERISSYGAIVWLMGLFFIFYGFLLKINKNRYNLSDSFRKNNGIKAKLIFWIFWTSAGGFVTFFLVSYYFGLINKVVQSGIPFFIISYSTVLILISLFIGKKFEDPFNKITANIENFFKGHNVLTTSKFSIFEFGFLQDFILDMFKVNEEKNIAKKELGDVAAQVAHDIRSPVSAILALLNECNYFSEEQRTAFRGAAHRIQDIANNLIESSRNGIGNVNTNERFLVSTAVLSIISEKKLEYGEYPIHIDYQFSSDSLFSSIRFNLIEFKRVISNLLNNSIEAMNLAGLVIVRMSLSDKNLFLDFIDAGCGMTPEMISRISRGEIVSNKESGFGLGFSHARKFLAEYNVEMEITSEIGQGTSISLSFPRSEILPWICDTIDVTHNSIVIILDDNKSIHAIWSLTFSKKIFQKEDIVFKYFFQPAECVAFIKSLTLEERERLILLTDFEFIGNTLNGLDVLSLTNLPAGILVSSYYESHDIIKKCVLSNVKILPKPLFSDVSFSILEHFNKDISSVDLVILEDNKNFSSILKYLLDFRNKEADIYLDSYDLFSNLVCYNPKTVRICLDYYISDFINGIELAQVLYLRGYENLYLASGKYFNQSEVPEYITVLPDKMGLLNL